MECRDWSRWHSGRIFDSWLQPVVFWSRLSSVSSKWVRQTLWWLPPDWSWLHWWQMFLQFRCPSHMQILCWSSASSQVATLCKCLCHWEIANRQCLSCASSLTFELFPHSPSQLFHYSCAERTCRPPNQSSKFGWCFARFRQRRLWSTCLWSLEWATSLGPWSCLLFLLWPGRNCAVWFHIFVIHPALGRQFLCNSSTLSNRPSLRKPPSFRGGECSRSSLRGTRPARPRLIGKFELWSRHLPREVNLLILIQLSLYHPTFLGIHWYLIVRISRISLSPPAVSTL